MLRWVLALSSAVTVQLPLIGSPLNHWNVLSPTVPANGRFSDGSLCCDLRPKRGLRLGDGEAPLVQSLPHDHPVDVGESEAGDGAQVVQGGDAARVDQVAISRCGDLAQGVEVWPLHEPVDV